ESKRNRKKKIHIRKNKNDDELDFILDTCQKNASESEYLTNIIYSYKKENKSERKKKIYKKIIKKINNKIKNNKNINKKKKTKKKIHIRKNKNDDELDCILDACPKNASESEYLANIIYSYLKEPQCEREKIIYKEIINKINDAIKNNRNIRIKTKSGKKIFI